MTRIFFGRGFFLDADFADWHGFFGRGFFFERGFFLVVVLGSVFFVFFDNRKSSFRRRRRIAGCVARGGGRGRSALWHARRRVRKGSYDTAERPVRPGNNCPSATPNECFWPAGAYSSVNRQTQTTDQQRLNLPSANRAFSGRRTTVDKKQRFTTHFYTPRPDSSPSRKYRKRIRVNPRNPRQKKSVSKNPRHPRNPRLKTKKSVQIRAIRV